MSLVREGQITTIVGAEVITDPANIVTAKDYIEDIGSIHSRNGVSIMNGAQTTADRAVGTFFLPAYAKLITIDKVTHQLTWMIGSRQSLIKDISQVTHINTIPIQTYKASLWAMSD